MLPISLYYQLSMISTLGRLVFHCIWVHLSHICHVCVRISGAFSRFSVIRLSSFAAKLSNRSIHSQWRDQPGAKPAHFKDGRVQFSTEGEDRTEFDLIFKCSHHWTFIQQLNFFRSGISGSRQNPKQISFRLCRDAVQIDMASKSLPMIYTKTF